VAQHRQTARLTLLSNAQHPHRPLTLCFCALAFLSTLLCDCSTRTLHRRAYTQAAPCVGQTSARCRREQSSSRSGARSERRCSSKAERAGGEQTGGAAREGTTVERRSEVVVCGKQAAATRPSTRCSSGGRERGNGERGAPWRAVLLSAGVQVQPPPPTSTSQCSADAAQHA
jgi:hypothetical protein